jgi:hypothetical protein
MNITVTTVKIERITITCPLTEIDRLEALNHAWNNGYKVVASGPKRLGTGEFSLNTFELTAEKEIT